MAVHVATLTTHGEHTQRFAELIDSNIVLPQPFFRVIDVVLQHLTIPISSTNTNSMPAVNGSQRFPTREERQD